VEGHDKLEQESLNLIQGKEISQIDQAIDLKPLSMKNICFGLKFVRKLHFGESHFRSIVKSRDRIIQSLERRKSEVTLNRRSEIHFRYYTDR
jgi:hypothetical protein